MGRVLELPPYRAVLVVDVKGFGGWRGREQADLVRLVPVVLREVFAECGLGGEWDRAPLSASTGDGWVLGLRSGLLPLLLNPVLPTLQEVLPDGVRMRATVHIGPLTGGRSLGAGNGEARVQAHRLLDARPVRELLDRSGPGTRVAAVVSERAYVDAVLSGYAGDDPGLYVPVPVRVKSFAQTAYLRVPVPTGELLSHGFTGRAPSAVRSGRTARSRTW
ncbi:hypothetical protein JOD54_002451 [Actinokineospora baliensis]|uniref:hypothetical protein n=1 Tax=Actinokineospora baliensis TaxID=547056 RepID=UPI001959EFA1|nr:hypothetical protein [Actinokineospora baliensis]MBM7772247.1 hypothetical protein [Actinokineospora baliensis]